MKICYLIQSHKSPEQIFRLIRTLKKSSPNCWIILSHDFSNCQLDIQPLQDLSNIHVISAKVFRGDFSPIQAYLNAIDFALKNDIDFDWWINLSGQDYPTQSPEHIEQFLSETTYDGFLKYFNVLAPESEWSKQEAITRYFYRYQQIVPRLSERLQTILRPLKAINYIQPFFRINFAYGLTIGTRVKPPFNENFICYGGSFFTTLSRKCVEYLYQFCNNNPQVVEYYKHVQCADESFFQTILVNNKSLNLCNDCKRYFDFSKTSNGHPATLTTADYMNLASSNTHFARKFDIAKDSKILDILDQAVASKY
ncbi:hypothetical protein NIES4071_90460 [Calothrix sp. NIES-4071]|nr:hypothetical protein NIES4071_90460 [Calothrix sp. NIES-4071]BAZ63313.1 hypothetical protein NIES4105_90390 [Calothrix sp. NIES-4105]